MSFAEVKELLPTLSAEERAQLLECLSAIEEGVSVEEYRAMKAAIEEELNDPSPGVPVEEIYKDLEKLTRGDVASA